jgi:hypothetical protein
MRWGILLCTEAAGGGVSRVARQALDDAEAYAAAGAAALVTGDHPAGGETTVLDPIAVLSAVAGRLDRRAVAATAGTGPRLMPSLVAGAAAAAVTATRLTSLDALAGAAVPVALAAGYRAADFEAAERPFADRFAARWKLAESLISAGRQVWCCAITPRAAERAGSAGAGIYLGPGLTEDRYRQLRAAAPDAPLAIRVDLDLADDDAPAASAAKYASHRSRGYPAEQALSGHPGELLARLGELAAALTPALTVLRVTWPGQPPEAARRQRDRFLAEIAPGLVTQ